MAASSLSFSSFLSSLISFRRLLFSLLSWVFVFFTCKEKQKKKIIILTQPDTHLALFDSQSAFIYKELVHLSKSLNGT